MTLGTEHCACRAKTFLLIAVMLPIVAAGATQEGNAPLLLKTSEIEVGVLPKSAAASSCSESRAGRTCCSSNPALWEEPEEAIPTPETLNQERYFFKAYNGHILWVGPQSEWYNQQTFYPRKRGISGRQTRS